MLVDYKNDIAIENNYGRRPKSTLPLQPIYVADSIDLDELIDAVVERLYRADIVHVWLHNCKVYADVNTPKISDGHHPRGVNHSLTIHPSDMGGNGRQWRVRYLIETHIMHDFDNMLTNCADDLLFDLYRYGKCDMEQINIDWLDRFGRQYNAPTRTVLLKEMPKKGRLKWAKSKISELMLPEVESKSKKQK